MKKNVCWALIICIAFYLGFAFFSFDQIPVGDEIVCLSGVESIAAGDIPRDLDGRSNFAIEHPPLYLYSMSVAARLFGTSGESVRLVGVVCFVLSLFLIYCLAKELFKDKRYSYPLALAACLLYAINSLAIQGSLLIDLDSTVLTASLLLFIYFFVKAPYLLKIKNLVWLGTLFALSLWAKDTTPLILILSIILFYFRSRDYKKGLYYSSLIFSIGLGLFLLSRWLYSYVSGAPFILPFVSVVWRLSSGSLGGGSLAASPLHFILSLLRTIWSIALWTSPFFLLLAALAMGERAKLWSQKRKLQKQDFLVIYSMLIFGGYLVTGQLGYSFPKFHYPIISVLCILISGLVFSRESIEMPKKTWLILSLSLPLLVIYNVVFIGDLLFTTDYLIKQSLVTGSPALQALLRQGAAKSLFYLLPLAVYLFILRVQTPQLKPLNRLVVSLLVMTVAGNLGLNILQAKADYATRYYYGSSKAREAVDFVDRYVNPESIIIVPVEILYHSKNNSRAYYFYLRETLGRGEQEFIKAISSEKIACVAYSISAQALSHFTQVINKPTVQQALSRSYSSSQFGPYT
ncbi:MAG: glycosyltransferase family 39 protein, partial [Candidatus Omnitrophica bacterium]|nr:glycosyltransferase family 39 protein [Candidatus Omnitrophota bacterium]